MKAYGLIGLSLPAWTTAIVLGLSGPVLLRSQTCNSDYIIAACKDRACCRVIALGAALSGSWCPFSSPDALYLTCLRNLPPAPPPTPPLPQPGGEFCGGDAFAAAVNRPSALSLPYAPDLRPRAASSGCRTLVAGIGEDDGATESTAAKSELSASIPLGARFFLDLRTTDASGDRSINSDFELSNASITVAMKDPLFKEHVVIEYAPATAEQRKYFRAVHLGTVDITIRPTDNSGEIKVHITVTRPKRLGNDRLSDFPDLDDRLIDLGHKRGIPPHFLRGQLAAEGRKDRMAYRYEPLGEGGDLRAISCDELTKEKGCLGNGRIVQSAYSPYRLASLLPSAYPAKVYAGRYGEIQLCGTAGPPNCDTISPAGAFLKPEDVEPRREYSISRKKTPTTDPIREALPRWDTPPCTPLSGN